MKKIETIWHHLLYSALTDKRFKFTQKELAEQFNYSLSTVNLALNAPSRIGAIRKESKFFVLENFEKFLYFWASVRNLQKDIIYQTYFDTSINEIEGLIPPDGIYACYSAVRKIFKEPPADYDEVYFYIRKEKLNEAIKRFPLNKSKKPNIFVLNARDVMYKYGQITTMPQTFVDIWNLKSWYSHDFYKFLEQKMYGILS